MAPISTIKLRRGVTAEWVAHNPVLAQGEPGFETNTRRLKIGDGSTPWKFLPYFVASLTGGGGEIGPEGPEGPPGTPGEAGPEGPQGIPGEVGPEGPEGPQGTPGEAGPEGPQGVPGEVGPEGPEGIQGETGDIGAPGATGDTGPQGLQGVKGDTGAQGVKGDTGIPGVKGDTGIPGVKGDTGDQGLQGVKGDTGNIGPQGLQGTQGVKGDTGLTGSIGPAGATGPTGATGATGPTGATGATGPSGQAAGKVFYCAPSLASDIATYKKMLPSPSTGAEQTITTPTPALGTDVLVASFATDPGVPGAVDYPAGSAFRRIYASVTIGTARLRVMVYKRDQAGAETLVRDEYSEGFTDSAAAMQEWVATSSVAGTLLATDRLVAKLYVQRYAGGNSGTTVTVYFEGSAHNSQIQTTISAGTQGPAGPTGPAGATGPTGPTGPAGADGSGKIDSAWVKANSFSLADGAYSSTNFNGSIVYNNATMFKTVDPDRISCVRAGMYRGEIQVQWGFAGAAAALRRIDIIRRNVGGGLLLELFTDLIVKEALTHIYSIPLLNCAAGDYIQIALHQESGVSMTISGVDFSLQRIGSFT